jgi:hypothetical protein
MASAIKRTGRLCNFGRMSRRKSTRSSDPSSRHPAAALRCFEAVAARRRCASGVVVGSLPAARIAAIFAGPADRKLGTVESCAFSRRSDRHSSQNKRLRIVSLAPQLRQALAAVAIDTDRYFQWKRCDRSAETQLGRRRADPRLRSAAPSQQRSAHRKAEKRKAFRF